MNVEDAAYETVRSYPGGSASLGPRVGINPTVLNSKVNPNTVTHHLMLVEASRIMGVSGDHRILHALAAEHGYTLQRVHAVSNDGDLLDTVLRANAAEGEFDRALQEALTDNLITPNEYCTIANAGIKQTEALLLLVAKVRALSEQGRAPP